MVKGELQNLGIDTSKLKKEWQLMPAMYLAVDFTRWTLGFILGETEQELGPEQNGIWVSPEELEKIANKNLLSGGRSGSTYRLIWRFFADSNLPFEDRKRAESRLAEAQACLETNPNIRAIAN